MSAFSGKLEKNEYHIEEAVQLFSNQQVVIQNWKIRRTMKKKNFQTTEDHDNLEIHNDDKNSENKAMRRHYW